jgi:hypothetical protein
MTTLSRRNLLRGTTALFAMTQLPWPVAEAQLPVYDGYGWQALWAVENGTINPAQVRYIHFNAVLESATRMFSTNNYTINAQGERVYNYQGRDIYRWLEASGSLIFKHKQSDPAQPTWIQVG